MAPPVGFWRFMDDVQEMTFPMASIDWHETPVVVKVEPSPTKMIPFVNSQPATEQFHRQNAIRDAGSGDLQFERVVANGELSSEEEDYNAKQESKDILSGRGQKDELVQANAPILRKETLVQEENLANLNTRRLFEDLINQNRELLQEKGIAVRWQDAASMAVKEAKDEVETRKQEAKAAKEAGIQAAATVQRQLDGSKKDIEALKGNKALMATKKTRADSEHREEMSVAEGKIEELQTGLDSAISNGHKSAERVDELSRINKELQNELSAKDQKLADKDSEKKVLQDQIDARDSTVQDIEIEADKDRKACDKYCREKFESERAQRRAEGKVGDLEREAAKVKAKTDKALKALQTRLDESVLRETRANARATKAEGDAEQLKKELDHTESARQHFEKKEGEWADLFAGNKKGARKQSQSTPTAANVPISKTEQRSPSTTFNEVEVSELADKIIEQKGKLLEKPEEQAAAAVAGPEAQEKIKELEGMVEEWRRVWKAAGDGEKAWKKKIRSEFNGKYQTALATERDNIRNELEAETQKTLAAGRKIIRQKAKRSLKARLAVKLKTQKYKGLQKLRRRAAAERARSKKVQVEWVFDRAPPSTVDADRSHLETQIRNQLQKKFQEDLSSHKTQWEVERVAMERSQLEVQIRNQLQVEYQNELSNFKTRWETEHSPSQAGLESQKIAAARDQTEVDISENSGSAAARSAQDDMLLASLSRESDETHELFQEIGRTGLPHDSGACVILRELNHAKDVLYDVKCELQNSDTVVNKNNLLQLVGSIYVNEHYIRQLDPATREVLIRQANEANRRLEYVQAVLGTNEDIPKDAMLEALLGPPKPELVPEHKQMSAPAQTAQASAFSQKANVLENAAAPGTSAFTPFGNSSFPGTSTFPLVNGFGNPAAPATSAFPLAFNAFENPAAPKKSETSTKGIFNPFENSHFASQSALDSVPSASQSTTTPQESAPTEPSSGLPDSMDFQSDGLSSSNSGQWPISAADDKMTSTQSIKDSGAPDRTAETKQEHEVKFKNTFGPLTSQGQSLAPPIGIDVAASPEQVFNFGGFSSTAPADLSEKDNQMDTVDGDPPLSGPRDHSGVATVGLVSSRPRQIKKAQSQQRRFAPKGHQVAHQALAKTQTAFGSMPKQAQQVNSQEQIPVSQQSGLLGRSRTAFTLEPNHSFDLTLSTSHMERGSHLRIQQDPAEYQKPLKIFQIPDEASLTLARSKGENPRKSSPPGLVSPQVEDDSHETPPGCEGWTGEMEKHAKGFLEGADIEQAKEKLYWLHPTTKSMTGLTRTLEKLKHEIEAQNERTSEQPAGWTSEMTDFVEGSLCGGNDVKTTANLLRLENPDVFGIQGLEEQVEKLRSEHINKKRARVQQDQMPQEPLGRTNQVTAIFQSRGRVNAPKGRRLPHKAFATSQTGPSPGSFQGQQLGPKDQGVDTEQGGSGGTFQQEHRSDQPEGWTDLMTHAVMTEVQKNGDVDLEFLGEVLRHNHDFETNDIQLLNKYLEKLRQEAKAEQVHRTDKAKNGKDEDISGIGGVGQNVKNGQGKQIPEMPVGWTDVMMETVKEMLRLGDYIDFIEEVIKAQFDFQTSDSKCLEEWLKKLESDHEAEVGDQMQ